MSSPGATELLIVLVIVLLILGPKRLPSLGRQLGGGIREFRKSFGGTSDSSEEGGHVRTPVGRPEMPPSESAAGGTRSASPPAGSPAVSPADAGTPAAEGDSERRSA